MSETSSSPTKRPLIFVTGMSGAGLQSTLKAFEDMGYEAVDNLRLSMVEKLIEVAEDARALAIAIDTRNANFSVETLLALYGSYETSPLWDAKLLFLDCSDETLQQRFTGTRRRHPLAFDRPVTDGVQREREMLWRVRDRSDHVIDTSALSIHDLRRLIGEHYRIDTESGLSIFITSFSYQRGLPREADLVFDVRFLRNPHWDLSLRPLTGQDPKIATFIKKDESYQLFMDNLEALILPLLSRYQQEGKSYLTIAIGCSGGRHRSVMIAEEITNILALAGYVVGLAHRDVDRT
ncbi:MAG: RNase adapter RapZ [Bdellovibrionales bacterium]